jgi:hypothetical protein
MSGKNETEEVLHKSLGGLAHPFAQPQTEAAPPFGFSKGGLPDCLRWEGLRLTPLHLRRALFIHQHRPALAESIPSKTAPRPLVGFEDESLLHRIAMNIPQLLNLTVEGVPRLGSLISR